MKLIVYSKRFLPELAALVCFAIATTTDASAPTTRLILIGALAIVLAIEVAPQWIGRGRQGRQTGAKALLGVGRSKGSR
jgi:hypothetical protein